MLRLFSDYEVHATWATVGFLFFNTKSEMLEAIPVSQPEYTNRSLSAYRYLKNGSIGADEESDPFHFASSLVNLIGAAPGQEVATHTFSHYHCNEPGQTSEDFRADLRAAIKIAQKKRTELKSLVFPRNQFNQEYLEVCKELGITSVRSNPTDWFWNIRSTQRESTWLRFFRGLDAYFPTGDKKTYPLSTLNSQLPIQIPASRLLRPWSPKYPFLNWLKLNRIKNEMSQAARDGEVYHLWWHPHNFGNHPQENLADLEKILIHFQNLKKEFGLRSMNMGEVAEWVIKTQDSQ